jgi:hypothetical protein
LLLDGLLNAQADGEEMVGMMGMGEEVQSSEHEASSKNGNGGTEGGREGR